MSPVHTVRVALRAILRNKLRAFLTTLGIVIGPATWLGLSAVDGTRELAHQLSTGDLALQSAPEQRARFERDNGERRRAGLPVRPPDERLLAALAAGLPDCAGVALGFDRTLMLALGAQHIDEVLSFPTARA